MAHRQVILLHKEAPPKPPAGTPCNGCGVCCAAETCPPARLLFLRAAGPCPALTWDGSARHYRCGLLTRPGHYLGWLPKCLEAFAAGFIRSRIAAGRGCDSDAEVENGENPA